MTERTFRATLLGGDTYTAVARDAAGAFEELARLGLAVIYLTDEGGAQITGSGRRFAPGGQGAGRERGRVP